MMIVLFLILSPAVFAQELFDYSKYESDQPELGVYLADLDDAQRTDLDFYGQGVLINGVVKGSGAEKAGLGKGDVIVKIGGKPVTTQHELIEIIQTMSPGDTTELLVVNAGVNRTVTATIGKKQAAYQQGEWSRLMEVQETERPYLGVDALDLTDQLAHFFHVNQGVLLSHVAEESPAEEAGFKAGDVLLTWNGEVMENKQSLVENVWNSKKGDEVTLVYSRKGQEQEVTLKLGGAPYNNSLFNHYFNQTPDGNWQKLGNLYRSPDLPKGLVLPPNISRGDRFFFKGQDDPGQHQWTERKKLFEHQEQGQNSDIAELRKEIELLRKEIRGMNKKKM